MFLLVTTFSFFALSHVRLLLPSLLPASCSGTFQPARKERKEGGKEWESGKVRRRGQQISCHFLSFEHVSPYSFGAIQLAFDCGLHSREGFFKRAVSKSSVKP